MEVESVSLIQPGSVCKDKKFDINKCIVCQQIKATTVTSSNKGRKRLKEAAGIRDDEVSKRLKWVKTGEQFQYHMNNECYKSYTHKKSLDKLIKHTAKSVQNEACPSRSVRSKFTPRNSPRSKLMSFERSCVVCGNVQHKGVREKFCTSEREREQLCF